MILVKATISASDYRCSEEGNDPDYDDWTYNWKNRIASFTAPQLRLDKPTGGMCRMSFGSIDFSPDFFTKDVETWPPPVNFPIVAYYTATDDSALETLLTGTVHRSGMTRDTITYDIYADEFDIDLLEEGTDYDGNTVALPMAIGAVSHEKPVRLADVVGAPTYHKALITGTRAKSITVIADNGSGKCRFTCGAHGFLDTAVVTTEDAARNAWDTSAITLIDANTFDKASLAFVANSTGHAYASGYWRVYDDGVPISANVTDNGDGTFSLSVAAVGEVTVSGTGQDSTLEEIFDWACGAGYLNLTLNSTLFTGTIPDIGYWADSQVKILDFLSGLCEWSCHLFYISGSTLYLIGMDEDNGSETLDDFDFLPSKYNDRPPISILRAEWVDRIAVEETVGKYIKEVPGKAWKKSAYPYGKDEETKPYTDVQADAETQLDSMLTIYHKPYCRTKIPLEGSLPTPGKKLTITDTMLGSDTLITVHARSFTYDFDQNETIVEGEGTIEAVSIELLAAGLGTLDLFGGAGLEVNI